MDHPLKFLIIIPRVSNNILHYSWFIQYSSTDESQLLLCLVFQLNILKEVILLNTSLLLVSLCYLTTNMFAFLCMLLCFVIF